MLFTVTVAFPVNDVPVQLTSLTAVKLYVVVLAGDTGIVVGLDVILLIIVGVVPSV